MNTMKLAASAFAFFCTSAAMAQDAMTSPTPIPSATTAMPTEAKEVEEHMSKMDTDKNGSISRQEADPEMKTKWKQWDRNEDGKIDREEYQSAAKAAPKNEKRAR